MLGVDVGQRYLATVATLDHGGQFYSGKEIRKPRGPLRPLAKTTGAEKALAVPHGAESPLARQTRRLKLNTNHTISKRILDTHPLAFIGQEELSGIRDRTKCKHGKKATKKQRRANWHASK